MDKDLEKSIEKTIKQMDGTEPLDKDIKLLNKEELEQLEQDLEETKTFIKMNNNGIINGIAKDIIESLETKIKIRKKELNNA